MFDWLPRPQLSVLAASIIASNSQANSFRVSRPWNTGNIGVVSRFFYLGPNFRKTVIQLLDFGYAVRLRLPLIVSAGFVLCHFLFSFLPRVEIDIGIEENGDDEEAADDQEVEEENEDDWEDVESDGGADDTEQQVPRSRST